MAIGLSAMAISRNTDISTPSWTASFTSWSTYKSLIINSDESLIFFSLFSPTGSTNV